MVEITDRESAAAWLTDKPHEVQVAFAARCALRALPSIGLAVDEPGHLGEVGSLDAMGPLSSVAPYSQKLFPCLRALISSATTAAFSVPNLSQCADSIFHSADAKNPAAFAAQTSADSAIYAVAAPSADEAVNHAAQCFEFSADAASFASGDRQQVSSATSLDANLLENGSPTSTFLLPIWYGDPIPEGLASGWSKLRTFWNSDPETWGFWREWYQGMLDGQPMDWELQKRVALIPDEDWRKGPEHVAALIEAIRARYVAEAVAERIELSQSGRLTLVPQEFPKDRHLGHLIDTVRDALDLATSSQKNELPKDCYQARLLRQTFGRYGNDPQRIEMDFERARVSLIDDMASDSIPASAANRDLIQSLADAAGAIRESDPDIAATRDRLNRIRLGQISREDAEKVADVAAQVAVLSEDAFAEDLLEDRFRLPGVRRDTNAPDPIVPVGAPERNAALEAQAAQVRLYSRLTKTWLYLKAFDRKELARLMDTPEVRIVSLLGSLSSIIAFIVTVVN